MLGSRRYRAPAVNGAPPTVVTVRAGDDLAAVVAAAPAHSLVVLTKGTTYDLDSTVTVSAEAVTIDGQGATVRLSGTPSGTADSLDRMFRFTGNNQRVENLNFAARAAGTNSVEPLAANVRLDGTRGTVHNCTFTTASNVAVMSTGHDSRITDNHVTGSGIIYSWAGSSRAYVTGNTIIDAPSNALSGTGNDGGGAYNDDCMVADNIIVSPGRMGIEDGALTRRTIIRNNRIDEPADMGISAVGRGAVVEGNTIANPVDYGVEVTADGCVVRGNMVSYDATPDQGAGIAVNDSSAAVETGAVVAFNAIHGAFVGVQLIGDLPAIAVTGNLINDAASRAISLEPTSASAITCNSNTIRFDNPANLGAGTRDGIVTANCRAITIVGNIVAYTAGSVGDDYDIAIRPTADTSVINGNVIDGGGRADATRPQIATNGATPAELIITSNMLVGGAYLTTTDMDTPTTANNVTT